MKKYLLAAIIALSVTLSLQAALNFRGLCDDMKRYTTTNVNWHAGDLYQHSIWVAQTICKWFNQSSFWVEGIDRKLQKVAIIAGFLHDIGKAGDLNYSFYDKPSHPRDGMLYILHKRPFKIKQLGKTYLFDFKAWFKQLDLDEQEQKIIALLIGIHWDFGGIILRSLANTDISPKSSYSLKERNCYIQFIKAVTRLAQEVNYNKGIIDRQLLQLAALIGAADLRGTQPTCACCSASCDEFTQKIEAVHRGTDVYKKYTVEERGAIILPRLLTFFEKEYISQPVKVAQARL